MNEDDLSEPPALMIRPVTLAPDAKTYTLKEWKEQMKTVTKYALRHPTPSVEDYIQTDCYIEQSGNSPNALANSYCLSPLFVATLFKTQAEAQQLKVDLCAYQAFSYLKPELLEIVPVKCSPLEDTL